MSQNKFQASRRINVAQEVFGISWTKMMDHSNFRLPYSITYSDTHALQFVEILMLQLLQVVQSPLRKTEPSISFHCYCVVDWHNFVLLIMFSKTMFRAVSAHADVQKQEKAVKLLLN